MNGLFHTLCARRELLATLIGRNLKIRYKGSALGFLWSLLTPGFFILIYAIFAKILKFNDGDPHYLQFLVGGIIFWQFTAGCLNDSLNSIVGNANLVKKVFFPRIILPVSTALADGVNFALTFLVLVAYLILSGAADFAHILWLVPAIVTHLLLGIGLACICGVSNVFFRDTQHIVGIVSQAWFFLSPVFYKVQLQLSFLPDTLGYLVYLNPMTGILALYRYALTGMEIPHFGGVLLSLVVSLAIFVLGIASMRAGDKKFGDVL